jgi:hypothetical protein
MRLSWNSVDASLQQTLQKGFLQMPFQPLSLPQAVCRFICIFAEPHPFPGALFLAMPCEMGFGAVDGAIMLYSAMCWCAQSFMSAAPMMIRLSHNTQHATSLSLRLSACADLLAASDGKIEPLGQFNITGN